MDNCWKVLADAGFQSVTVRVNSDRREGQLVGTSPARGGRAVPGQVITILISNGSDYVDPAATPPPPPPSSPAPEPEPEPEPEPVPEEPPVEPPTSPGRPSFPDSAGPDGPPSLPDG
jgi:beta-lactam-binding protein with PASTA domain